MNKALVARGLSKNGVRSFIETDLEKLNSEKVINYYVFTDEYHYVNKYKNLNVIYIKKNNKLFWDNIILPYFLVKHRINEVIYTKNIIPLTNIFLPIKKNIYVLDLAFKYKNLKAYKFFDSLYMNFFLGLSLFFADQVVAISKFTKNEIIKFYPFVNSKKITIRHLEINNIFKKETNQKLVNFLIKKYDLKLPFIFYCGSISPRKNIISLLKAFNSLKDDLPHYLYLISSRSWNSSEEINFLENIKNKKIKILKNVTDEKLAIFYSIADLFVYPSLYEGFGLPLKEAEACGCKVLASDIPTTLEVSPKAYTFRAGDANDLAKKIRYLLK